MPKSLSEKLYSAKISQLKVDRSRLLISAYFSHACTSRLYVVHAAKKHALTSKRLRYYSLFSKKINLA